MTKQGIKSLGPNSFTITYSPGHTDKEFLDAFRLALTETENVEGQTRPKYGWEDYDHDFAYTPHEGSHELPWELDSGAFVARAINDDGLGYKYACIYIENNKLVIELRDDWDNVTHSGGKYCKYRTRGLHVIWDYAYEENVYGLHYYSEINHLDRQTLLVSASARWLVFEIQPYSKYSSIGNTLFKSAIGIFEAKYEHTNYKTKAFLTTLLALSGKYSGRWFLLDWLHFHAANLYPLLLYPTDYKDLKNYPTHGSESIYGEYFGDHTLVGVATDFDTVVGAIPTYSENGLKLEDIVNRPASKEVIMALKPIIDPCYLDLAWRVGTWVYSQLNKNAAPDGVLYGIKLSTFKGDNYTKFNIACDEEYMLKESGIKKDHIAWQARGEDMVCSFLIPL